jgi:hypothetical protein
VDFSVHGLAQVLPELVRPLDPVQLSLHALLTLAMWHVMRWSRRVPQLYPLYPLFWLPGTVAHELAHLLMGFVFMARPVSFSVIPSRTGDGSGWKLGEVGFTNLRWWNQLPVGLAPLLLLPPLAAWLLLASLSSPLLSGPSALMKFAAIQCLVGAWPSPTDWGYAWRTVTLLLAASALAGAGYWLVQMGLLR